MEKIWKGRQRGRGTKQKEAQRETDDIER